MLQTSEVNSSQAISKCQSIAAVLWPSFIIAGITNSIFWVFVDPHNFGELLNYPGLTRISAYSIGFIVLWAAMALSSYLTQLFCKPCDEINRKSS